MASNTFVLIDLETNTKRQKLQVLGSCKEDEKEKQSQKLSGSNDSNNREKSAEPHLSLVVDMRWKHLKPYKT